MLSRYDRVMDFICPNCGEPLDEDARVCPFCGSDDETGWRPDADDFAFELPDDDDPFGPEITEPVHPRSWPGVLLVAFALAVFGAAAWSAYGWGALPPLLFLLVCTFLFVLGTREAAE